LACGLLLAACGSDSNVKPDGGLGGIGGAGGSSDAGLDRNLSGSAGTGGSSGGSGGAGGGPVAAYCSGITPDYTGITDAGCPAPYTIADFSSEPPYVFGMWGSAITGGRYANGALTDTIDAVAGRWNLTGTIDGVIGFGLWWLCSSGGGPVLPCTIDLSRYRGIEITLKGNVGPSGKMGVSLGRAENDVPKADGCGTCGGSDGGVDGGNPCTGPRVEFEVPNDGADHTVVLTWDMFSGGRPNERLDPHQLTGWFFYFTPPAMPDADGGVADASPADAAADAAADVATDPDGSTDAPFDPDAAVTADAAADSHGIDALIDGAVNADAAPRPSYNASISIDSIRLVCY
jgi:hypothetical protein